jgi:hypothetical protein
MAEAKPVPAIRADSHTRPTHLAISPVVIPRAVAKEGKQCLGNVHVHRIGRPEGSAGIEGSAEYGEPTTAAGRPPSGVKAGV